MYSPIDVTGAAISSDIALMPLRGPSLPWKSKTTLVASVNHSGPKVELLACVLSP
jgi:hypothetical protein